MKMTRPLLTYVRIINNVKRIRKCLPKTYYSTFTIDQYTKEPIHRRRPKTQTYFSEITLQYFTDSNNKLDISQISHDELNDVLSELLAKQRDKQIEKLITECTNYRKFMSSVTLKSLFRHYSINGKPDMVVILQNYCSGVDPILFRRNGEFLHYLAKAQCMKGNADKGLSILKICYKRYQNLRSFYRIIFRELIQDSVLNRSEATLVIFKKNVLEFSDQFSDHYPLVCFWHICWASNWFSDQMLANELVESSKELLHIIGDKAGAFSTMALKDYNEDAVVRLLQTLLKYEMIQEYAAVLQVLFSYKLKIKDIRGCTEIVRNCKVLGITLPSDQQGRYIKMLIEGETTYKQPTEKVASKTFKLKF